MAGATRSIDIKAPPQKCFEVITDYAKYGEFLSEVRGVKLLEQSAADAKVAYDVDFGVKKVKYTLRHQHQPPHRMEWSFVEGEVMKDNRGSWALEDDGQGGTRATYNIEVALGPLVPKALINALVEGSLPKMLEAFKKRIEAR